MLRKDTSELRLILVHNYALIVHTQLSSVRSGANVRYVFNDLEQDVLSNCEPHWWQREVEMCLPRAHMRPLKHTRMLWHFYICVTQKKHKLPLCSPSALTLYSTISGYLSHAEARREYESSNSRWKPADVIMLTACTVSALFFCTCSNCLPVLLHKMELKGIEKLQLFSVCNI